jgi:hypothetical protein
MTGSLLAVIAPVYVILLPFVLVAIPLGRFRVTVADLAAAVMLLALAGQPKEAFAAPRFRLWLGVLGAFVLLLALSAARAGGGFPAVMEVVPYVHAWLVTLALAVYLSNGDGSRVTKLQTAFKAGLAIALLPAVAAFFFSGVRENTQFWYVASFKYHFFFLTPTQFVCFLVVTLMATLACGPLSLPGDLLLFMAAGIGALSASSRAGLAAYLFVSCAFFVLPASWRGREMSHRGVMVGRFSFAAFLLWLVLAPQTRSFGARSLTVIDYAEHGKMVDGFRKTQFKRAYSEARSRPLAGMGLGEFARSSKDGFEIHSTYLTLLVEVGVAGLIGLAALQLVLVGAIVRSPLGYERKLAGLAALAGLLLFMFAHHILRERWIWALYAMLVAAFA